MLTGQGEGGSLMNWYLLEGGGVQHGYHQQSNNNMNEFKSTKFISFERLTLNQAKRALKIVRIYKKSRKNKPKQTKRPKMKKSILFITEILEGDRSRGRAKRTEPK